MKIMNNRVLMGLANDIHQGKRKVSENEVLLIENDKANWSPKARDGKEK